jgi:hypothetical protein
VERAPAACVAPAFVAGLCELVRCHVEGAPPTTLGTRGARPFPCPSGCCEYTPERPHRR